MNLCLNATQAIGAHGGVLQVGLSDRGADSPLVGPCVCLTVQDDGCGMEEEVQKLIFEPFFTTKEPGKGTGLGLSVVQGVVDGHKGSIRVRSRPGKGSTFEIFLLLVEQAPPARPASATTSPFAAQGESILVIDDQLAVATYIQRLLEQSGYQAAIYTSAVQGLAQFTGHRARYRLLVVDLSMPDLSGLEVIREVRRNGCRQPIVLISGDHHRVDLSELSTDPLVHFLPKPFGARALLDLVKRYMGETAGKAN